MTVLNTIVLLAALTAPPDESVMTLSRFPPADVCQQAIDFNNAVERSLLARQAMRPQYWYEVQEALNDCRSASRAWWLLRYAWGTDWPPFRQEYLDCLHREIGDEAFYTGTMPCPIPLWFTYGD